MTIKQAIGFEQAAALWASHGPRNLRSALEEGVRIESAAELERVLGGEADALISLSFDPLDRRAAYELGLRLIDALAGHDLLLIAPRHLVGLLRRKAGDRRARVTTFAEIDQSRPYYEDLDLSETTALALHPTDAQLPLWTGLCARARRSITVCAPRAASLYRERMRGISPRLYVLRMPLSR